MSCSWSDGAKFLVGSRCFHSSGAWLRIAFLVECSGFKVFCFWCILSWQRRGFPSPDGVSYLFLCMQVKHTMTATEKILARASEKGQLVPGENVWVKADILMTHDVCGPGTIGIFKKEFGQNAKVHPINIKGFRVLDYIPAFQVPVRLFFSRLSREELHMQVLYV